MTGQELKKFCGSFSIVECLSNKCPYDKKCLEVCSKLGIPYTWGEEEIEKYDKIYGTKKSSDEGIN